MRKFNTVLQNEVPLVVKTDIRSIGFCYQKDWLALQTHSDNLKVINVTEQKNRKHIWANFTENEGGLN